jgi:phospholipid/cholesterol/gamma-HCH transport system substrate-binding protein
MKLFQERNPLTTGAIGIALTAGLVLGALNYTKLPFVNHAQQYSAYFAESGGLLDGSVVQVSGVKVGQVRDITLDGPRVLVTFTVDDAIEVGDRSEAAIKTKSLLGAKFLELIPRGEGTQSGTIPVERTSAPYQLPDALGDLAATIGGLNTNQVSDSLQVLADTFKDTPADVKVAVQGVARFSQTLDERDAQLRSLLANANKVTEVLAQRSDQVVSLIADTDALLVELQHQSSALDQISGSISAVTRQIKGTIAENRTTLKPALDKLNGVLTIIENRKGQVQDSIKRLNAYAMSLGESVSSGPFFKAYLANLIPGQFVQPFVDAAFSDLGLDPHVLSPSQRLDPQTGQPGTPALPNPFPRTGQGGEPNLHLPDAISGNPGDARYPYREPLPAPPLGGPPPGPPATIPPEPTTDPLHVPAPNEPAPSAPTPGGPAPGPVQTPTPPGGH